MSPYGTGGQKGRETDRRTDGLARRVIGPTGRPHNYDEVITTVVHKRYSKTLSVRPYLQRRRGLKWGGAGSCNCQTDNFKFPTEEIMDAENMIVCR